MKKTHKKYEFTYKNKTKSAVIFQSFFIHILSIGNLF